MRKTELQRMTPCEKIAFIRRTGKQFRYLKPSVQKDIREFLQKNTKIAQQLSQYITI